MKKIPKKFGFTIIELLVVISIISMLASIVFASISTVTQRAKIIKFKQDLVQLRNGIVLYRSQNGGTWPYLLSLDTIASDLYSRGIYNYTTVTIPGGITAPAVGAGLKNGGDVGCGSATSYLTSEYVFYFDYPNPITSSIGQYIASQFPEKYHGSVSYGALNRCFEFY